MRSTPLPRKYTAFMAACAAVATFGFVDRSVDPLMRTGLAVGAGVAFYVLQRLVVHWAKR